LKGDNTLPKKGKEKTRGGKKGSFSGKKDKRMVQVSSRGEAFGTPFQKTVSQSLARRHVLEKKEKIALARKKKKKRPHL